MDGWMGEWTGGRTDERTDIQREREIEKIDIRGLYKNCLDKWRDSVDREHRKLKLVPSSLEVFCTVIMHCYQIVFGIVLFKI